MSEAIAITTTPPPKPPWKPSSLSIGFLFGMLAVFLAWVLAGAPRSPTIASARAAVVSHMPTEVNVNGIEWRVRLTAFGGDTDQLGQTYCNTRTVWISQTANDQREVLMHELSHAIVCGDAFNNFDVNNLWYNSKTNNSHEGIYKFSEAWAALLERNPDLAAYLGSAN